MKEAGTLEPKDKFSYRIDFRYKKINNDLKSTNFINSALTIMMDDPVPEPMQRLWTTIIRELNPTYSQIEIINVKDIKN